MQQPPSFGQSPHPGGYRPLPPPPRKPTPWQLFRSARKRTQWSIGCGVSIFLVALSLCTCGSVGAALGPQRAATLVPTTTTSIQTDTPTQAVQATPTVPTHPTTQPTRNVTVTPSFDATPTATSAPVETPLPTQPPTPTPVPTHPPTPLPFPMQPPTGLNGNTWGYSFAPGNLIYSPEAQFCSYFGCISTFWTATRGYVVECVNGLYSHSGGIRGACSRDGGPAAILYSH